MWAWFSHFVVNVTRADTSMTVTDAWWRLVWRFGSAVKTNIISTCGHRIIFKRQDLFLVDSRVYFELCKDNVTDTSDCSYLSWIKQIIEEGFSSNVDKHECYWVDTHTRPCDLEGEKQKVRRGKDKEGHFSLCVPDMLWCHRWEWQLDHVEFVDLDYVNM